MNNIIDSIAFNEMAYKFIISSYYFNIGNIDYEPEMKILIAANDDD
jgi:hypothetical protein